MPFRRNYQRRPYRKRYYGARRVTTGTSHKIARFEAKKAIYRESETKMIDGYVTGAITAVSSDGILLSAHGTYASGSFVPITQGSALNQYVGSRIKPTWLKIKWATDYADTTNLMSIVVLQSKGLWVNGGTMANIYESTGTTTAPLSAVDTTYNDRFRILFRREVSMDSDDPTRYGKIKIGPKMLRSIFFNDASGSVEAGHIMIGFISDSNAITHPTIRCYWRLYYKDL